jgi:hypothetical protein
MDAELREWLGLAPADVPVYVAVVCIGIAFFTGAGIVDTMLIVTALICSAMSCVMGMKQDARLSVFTNNAKLFAYPFYLAVCMIAAILNFRYWN